VLSLFIFIRTEEMHLFLFIPCVLSGALCSITIDSDVEYNIQMSAIVQSARHFVLDFLSKWLCRESYDIDSASSAAAVSAVVLSVVLGFTIFVCALIQFQKQRKLTRECFVTVVWIRRGISLVTLYVFPFLATHMNPNKDAMGAFVFGVIFVVFIVTTAIADPFIPSKPTKKHLPSKTVNLNTPRSANEQKDTEEDEYEEYGKSIRRKLLDPKTRKKCALSFHIATIIVVVLAWSLLARFHLVIALVGVTIFYVVASVILTPILKFFDCKKFSTAERIVAAVSVAIDFVAYALLLAFALMCFNGANMADTSHTTAWIGLWISWNAFWLISEIFSLVPLTDRIFCRRKAQLEPAMRFHDDDDEKVTSDEDSTLNASYSAYSVSGPGGYGTSVQSETEMTAPNDDIEL